MIFSLHLPAHQAVECVETTQAAQIRLLEVWEVSDPDTVLRAVFTDPGGPGAAYSFALDVPSSGLWKYYVTTVSPEGGRSCPSNVVSGGVDLTGVKESKSLKTEWFDVAGRRVERPDRPGWYMRRRGNERRAFVVYR